MSRSLEAWVRGALAAPETLETYDPSEIVALAHTVTQTAERAFAGDAAAREDLHRAAYRLFVARHSVPWQNGAPNCAHPLFATLLWTFTTAWAKSVADRHADLVSAAPRGDVDGYVDWVTDVVRRDRSNVTHPLFDFLANDATRDQLRTFLFQETPFDIHFGDVICSLLPGVHGEPKLEISANFWDEMGNGDLARHHRGLRLAMTGRLGLDPDAHTRDVDAFAIEEIELANAYFLASFDRAQAPLLLGMLLATESMVPGRLDRQIEGWRRVGLLDDEMTYLLEHTVVDVAHANGWIDHVIKPVLREDPDMVVPITLGVALRLELAGAVCDRMLDMLRGAAAELDELAASPAAEPVAV